MKSAGLPKHPAKMLELANKTKLTPALKVKIGIRNIVDKEKTNTPKNGEMRYI